MKISDIAPGFLYHDGKLGLRDVLSVNRDGTLRYRLLAAKVERWLDGKGNATTEIGAESTVTVAAFAAWAKSKHEGRERIALLLQINAARLKLSASELELLNRLTEEFPGARKLSPRAGLYISVEGESSRTLNSLAKKGVWIRQGVDEIELTVLGAAVVARVAAAAAAAASEGSQP